MALAGRDARLLVALQEGPHYELVVALIAVELQHREVVEDLERVWAAAAIDRGGETHAV